jgi:hypothetical protein
MDLPSTIHGLFAYREATTVSYEGLFSLVSG